MRRFRILSAVVFLFFIACILACVVNSSSQQCIYVMSEDFQRCGNRADELITFQDMKKNRIYNISGPPEADCTGNIPCRKIFKLSRISLQSFGSKTLVHISDMLRRCCGNCTKYFSKDVKLPLSESNMTELKESDIVFPVPSRSSLISKLHGFYFIPVFEIPSAFYITRQKPAKQLTREMIESCLSNWPLLVICLLMALIAGFVGWILETWGNKKEFPRPFHIGMWEGFWWSFVSMTTVGYGDKAPKSFVARIFSVFWILVGITMTSIYIAGLSSQIIAAQEPKESDLTGKRVGTLKNAMHDSIMIAEHGGIVQTVDYNNTINGILRMVTMLENNELDGFLITRPIYYYFAREIEEKEKYQAAKLQIANIKLLRAEKSFRYGKMATGMLVKREEDYEYFGRYFKSNWLQIQGCYLVNLNYKENKFQFTQPSFMIGLFYHFLWGALGVIGGILLFGLVYEKRRRFLKERSVQTHEQQS